MKGRRTIFLSPMTCMASLGLVWLCAQSTEAQNNRNYIFLLASGFLCDPGDWSTCPAAAKSAQGDSYEMSGAGTFDVQNKSVKMSGTYTRKAPNGNVLETGVWLAAELVSFDSYGAAPAVLMRQGSALGPAPFGPKGSPIMLGPMPTGGLAVFRVRLLPIRGPSTTAVLQVNCALGDVPRERSVEGIQLKLERDNTEYAEEVGGRVMFLSTRPETSTPSKAPGREAAPQSTEPPHN